MKVAIITDTHCGAGNDNRFLNESFLEFYDKIFFPYIIENGIKTVIHLGDTFDRRKYINFNTLNSWRDKVFSKLNSYCDRVDIIIGNHDTYFKQTNSVNSITELLTPYEKFKIYSKAEEIKIFDKQILYVPWICDENREETFDAISKSNSKICMGHLEIEGFELYGGHISGGLSPKIFDKFYTTLSGHYHGKSSKGSIHYLGAPYPMMWGDYGIEKGFHTLDLETLNLKFIKNDISTFHKVYYDDSAGVEYDQFSKTDYSHLANKFVKIIVKTKQSPYMFDKFVEEIQSCNPADLTIIESSFDDVSANEKLEIDEAKDTLTILNEYAESFEVYSQPLKELLKEVYLEALNDNEHIQSSS